MYKIGSHIKNSRIFFSVITHIKNSRIFFFVITTGVEISAQIVNEIAYLVFCLFYRPYMGAIRYDKKVCGFHEKWKMCN